MRPVHLTHVLSEHGGGIPPVVHELTRAQCMAGAGALAMGVRDPLAPRSGPSDIPILLGKVVGPRALGFAPSLQRELQQHSPDVVHLHGLFTWSSHLASSAARRGTPVLVAPHGMLAPWALGRSAWKKRLFLAMVEAKNLRRASCFHALNEAEARHIRAFGVRQPIVILPNGIASKVLDAPPVSSRLEEFFPDLAGRRRMLFLGRIDPVKNLVGLVQAWGALHREGALARNDWVLVLAGPDWRGHRRVVEEVVRQQGLEGVVSFTGPLQGEIKQAALEQSDAFVLASFTEGFHRCARSTRGRTPSGCDSCLQPGNHPGCWRGLGCR